MKLCTGFNFVSYCPVEAAELKIEAQESVWLEFLYLSLQHLNQFSQFGEGGCRGGSVSLINGETEEMHPFNNL